MKYILMMHGQKGSWDEYARWSKEDLQRNVEFMQRFNKELHDSGVFVDTKGLAWPQEAKIVRAGSNGGASYGRRVPGIEGVPCRILGYRRRESRAGVQDCCPRIRRARARRETGEYAD